MRKKECWLKFIGFWLSMQRSQRCASPIQSMYVSTCHAKSRWYCPVFSKIWCVQTKDHNFWEANEHPSTRSKTTSRNQHRINHDKSTYNPSKSPFLGDLTVLDFPPHPQWRFFFSDPPASPWEVLSLRLQRPHHGEKQQLSTVQIVGCCAARILTIQMRQGYIVVKLGQDKYDKYF